MKIKPWILAVAMVLSVLFSATSRAAIVFSDDMSGTYSTHWTTVTSSGSGSGSFVSGELVLNPNASTSEFSAQTSSFDAPYSTILHNNSGTVTWSFNVRTTAALSAAGNQVAFVLAASSSDLTTGNGYAVYVGSIGTPDPFQLVRYTGGLNNGTRTVLAADGDLGNTGTTRGSVRITFEPGTDTWSLFGVSGASYVDPTTVPTQLGSSVSDNTYTGDNLSILALWANSTSANRIFDNVTVSVAAVPEPRHYSLIATFALAFVCALRLRMNRRASGQRYPAGRPSVARGEMS